MSFLTNMLKKLVLPALVLLLAMLASAQLNFPLGGHGSSDDNTKRNARVTSRTLTGTVLTKAEDRPIENAVVYLKNKKTLGVKSFFSLKDGTYRFPELATNVDYEVYAEKDGKKSDTKTLSEFDDRATPNINLRIDMSK